MHRKCTYSIDEKQSLYFEVFELKKSIKFYACYCIHVICNICILLYMILHLYVMIRLNCAKNVINIGNYRLDFRKPIYPLPLNHILTVLFVYT